MPGGGITALAPQQGLPRAEIGLVEGRLAWALRDQLAKDREGQFGLLVQQQVSTDLQDMGGIPMFPLVFDKPYWFELDAGFQTCFRRRLEIHMKDYRAFVERWAREPKRAGSGADSALYEQVKLLYDETDAALLTCQTEACKNKCALAGKRGEVGGMLTQECQCVK